MGKSSITMAKEFGCSSNTVNRIVKGMIAKDEYLELKESRSKGNSLKELKELDVNINSDKDSSKNNQLTEDRIETNSSNSKVFNTTNNIIEDSADINKVSETSSGEVSKLDFTGDFDDNSIDESLEIDSSNSGTGQTDSFVFNEVIPLISDFGFENNKQKVSLKPLQKEILPEIVYMLVKQNIELDIKPLSEFTEWSFLPIEEKERNAITLFENPKSAKRACARGQRVIKIPDSKVFITTSSFLLLKGITRIVLDDLLISIDENDS